RWAVHVHGGRTPTGQEAIAWAERAASLGAGELLVTSMDEDGHEDGYDLELLRAVTRTVRIPVIASGGAGSPRHLLDAIVEADADAVLAASIFHYRKFSIAAVKEFLSGHGVPVRPVKGV
ncbi:MAG TPA: HisA/HisF-related TIM barrel protein, partial [bacterium]|nr:HisA/HisF-related TIM barrel protein [bacterium]